MALPGTGKGARDGHDFIDAAYAQGIRLFLVQKPLLQAENLSDASVLMVPEVLGALQAVAAAHRRNWSGTVWALTGSNGKTQIKEWIASLMSGNSDWVKTPGSFNSQLGVPLSVLGINAHHQWGLFEAGISLPGEMAKLEAVLKPEHGLLTHFGEAHQEGFRDLAEKLREKLKLFAGCGSVVAPFPDSTDLQAVWREHMHETAVGHYHFWFDATGLTEGNKEWKERLGAFVSVANREGIVLSRIQLWVLRALNAAEKEPGTEKEPGAKTEPGTEKWMRFGLFPLGVDSKGTTWTEGLYSGQHTGPLQGHIPGQTPDLLSGFSSGHTPDYPVFESTDHYPAALENLSSAALWLWTGGKWKEGWVPRFRPTDFVPMRMEIKELPGSSWLINDSYSLDLDSLTLALREWAQRRPGSGGVILLSEPDHALDAHWVALLKQYSWNQLILVGPAWQAWKKELEGGADPGSADTGGADPGRVLFFPNTEALLANWPLGDLQHKGILLKGARKFAFERVEQHLLVQSYQTVLEIDLEALAHNFRVFGSFLHEGVRTMVMVKAQAYGSGSLEVARSLQEAGADYLAVAYGGEGLELRRGGIHLPLMVMNEGNLSPSQLLEHGLEPDLYSLGAMGKWMEVMATRSEPHRFHLQLDTGMRRLGLHGEDALKGLQLLHKAPKSLRIQSIYTHLTASEDPDQDDLTKQQVEALASFASAFEDMMGYRPWIHALNTAGIIRFPQWQGDMVRLGLGLYGIEPTSALRNRLKPLTRFKTVLVHQHQLPKGSTVGYGNEGKMPEDGWVGVLPVGYADGLPRALGSGKVSFWLGDRKVPTIGRVSMDFCMVYLGQYPGRIGQEVLLFGPEGSVQEWATQCRTIPYEILTGLSPRVQRVYVRG
jgi:alanine racemase